VKKGNNRKMEKREKIENGKKGRIIEKGKEGVNIE
jgi:hypothetical protein